MHAVSVSIARAALVERMAATLSLRYAVIERSQQRTASLVALLAQWQQRARDRHCCAAERAPATS
jgi:hypothetical protein